MEFSWRHRRINHTYSTDGAHPHRLLLLKKLTAPEVDAHSFLEVGCGVGDNLFLLAQARPQSHCVGIDINPQAAEKAWRGALELDLKNIHIEESAADDFLKKTPSKNYDLAFSDASLMYLGPDKIGTVLRELVRVSRRRLGFVEFHDPLSQNSRYYDAHWVHNFSALFKELPGIAAITEEKITEEVWGGHWSKLGYIITVDLAFE